MFGIIYYTLLYLLTAIICLVSAAYLYYAHTFRYFKKRGIPSDPAIFPVGNLGPVFSQTVSYHEVLSNMYKKHKGEQFVGFFQFWKKCVLIIDIDLIKNVLVKDFEYFKDKNLHYSEENEPLTAHLFAVNGPEWKVRRTKMTPVFTAGKLKYMFQTVMDVGHRMTLYMDKLTSENEVVECKELFTRYGIATIASTAFGLDSDVLTDKNSKFFKMLQTILAPTLGGLIRNGLWFFGADIAKAFNIKIIPKDAHEFFMNLAKDTVEHRQSSGETRNDFLQLLIQMLHGIKDGDKEYSITMNELASETYDFIVAGFETTSNTMSFFLYEMALNPEVQKKVRAEVDAVEEINYDTLSNMEYLDMALSEAMRKHSSLGFLNRMCTKDYNVPGTDLVIEKGTNILISSSGVHWDPELYPEPEKFIPERFSKENKQNIKPCTFLPFGEGPRFCIGMRFGRMSVKAALARVLREYEVQTAPNTPIPLKYEPKTVTTTAKGGMWLRFIKRKKSS